VSLIFVDTGAWIGLAHPRDERHVAARAFSQSLPRGTRLVTSNYVVSETITWLTYRGSRRAAVDFHRNLERDLQSGAVLLDWIDAGHHDRGWKIFQQYHDQVLSFTDCTSAVVARERNVDYVFSFDRDFRILGFDVRPGQ
ncbi:MAG: PIN domain-containing protein, partial [Dehalococcoidia bacterium]